MRGMLSFVLIWAVMCRGVFANNGTENGGQTFDTVTCAACRQLHLVNP